MGAVEEEQTEPEKKKPAKEKKKYKSVTVDELMDELDSNAASASDKYKGKNLKVKGRLDVIDSDGKYITIMPIDNEYSFIGVNCSIKNDKQLKKVKSLKKGDIIKVKGTMTDVGEVLGYSLDIDSIKG